MDVKLILCGHGGFGTGMHGALNLLCGKNEKVQSLDFNEGDSFDDLVAQMEEIVSASPSTPTVICTDVQGGSPFKAAVLTKMKHPEIGVIAGTNFPLLMELMFSSDATGNLGAQIAIAIESARNSLTSVEI